MREITTHKVRPDEKLQIKVLDAPGHGGASHVYAFYGMQLQRNSAAMSCPDDGEDAPSLIFQCGGIPDHGTNGVTQEALLAVVIDRLRSFQNGPYPSADNADALNHCEAALAALQRRTRTRLSQGVEGQEVNHAEVDPTDTQAAMGHLPVG